MDKASFNPGDILIAHDRRLNKGYHPIIYIEPCSSTDFIGGMLTHFKCQNNIKIPGSFFIKEQDFTDSYLVRRRFIKFESWGPFTKINQLTPEGVDFVLKQTAEYPEETFYAYYIKLKARTLKGVYGIKKFQAQDELNALVVKIIKEDKTYTPRSEKIFIQNWRDRIGEKMHLNLHYVEDISVEKSGKFRIVKNNIKHLINA